MTSTTHRKHPPARASVAEDILKSKQSFSGGSCPLLAALFLGSNDLKKGSTGLQQPLQMRQHRRRARTENWKESTRQEKAPTTINKRTRPVRFTVRFTRTCTRRQRRPAAQHSSNKWKLNRKMWQQQKEKSNQTKGKGHQYKNQIKSNQ